MAEKTINPKKIKGVKASYDDMSDTISDPSGFVADASSVLLEGGTAAIKSVSKGIDEVVKDLDSYLNDVADAFQESDLALSNTIEEGTIATFNGGSDKQNIKNTEAYGKLPG